jgi:hypothetical protein
LMDVLSGKQLYSLTYIFRHSSLFFMSLPDHWMIKLTITTYQLPLAKIKKKLIRDFEIFPPFVVIDFVWDAIE